MTVTGPPGPPYPEYVPGSNAIGRFAIGISPIGTIPIFDPWPTIASQYANSPILDTLILDFYASVDMTENFDVFFDMMWDIDTAQGYGLDVWGRIVGVNRVIQLPESVINFGFEQDLPGVDTFGPRGTGTFYSGETFTQSYALTDAAYRQLILAKAAFNITNCSIPAINALLMTLFGSSGVCYVQDVSTVPAEYFGVEQDLPGVDTFGPLGALPFYGGAGSPMSMVFVFDFTPSPVQMAIIFQSGVLPKPCGVAAYVKIPGFPPQFYDPPEYN